MRMLSDVDSASPAQNRRVARLAKKLAESLHAAAGVDETRMAGLCLDLDEAVQAAALEGNSIAEAIAEYIEEGWSPDPATGYPALASLAGYGSAGIDVSALSLPEIPRQAARLLRTSGETTSAAELAEIAGSDPVLAAKLTGAVNAARFASPNTTLRPEDAILWLGLPEARKILLTASLSVVFASKPLQALWRHSEMVAFMAYELAQLAGIDPETAYIAGLLHDIGRLAFTRLPARVRTRVRNTEQEWLAAGFPVAYAETLTYGLDHAALGATCLRVWGLPDVIVEAVALHHRPQCSGSILGAILNLAEDLVARATNSGSEDLWPDMRRTAACLAAGITADDFEAFEVRHSAPKQACG